MKKLLPILAAFLIVFSGCKKEETGCDFAGKTGGGAGCSYIILFQELEPDKYVYISWSNEFVSATDGCNDLSLTDPTVFVELHVGGSDPDSVYFDYCNDVVLPNYAAPDIWTATAGSFTFEVSPLENYRAEPSLTNPPFDISLLGENITFISPDGQSSYFLPEIFFDNVRVGWLPG